MVDSTNNASSVRPADLVGTVLANKYRLDRLIGEGGFGAVYQATHLLGNAVRAVKVIHPQMVSDEKIRNMFVREAQAVMRLKTPRAVVVHDVHCDKSDPVFLVMEFIEGESLRHYLRRKIGRGRGLPVEEAVRIASQVCEALVEAHRKGVVHRDLKPDNIMMVPDEKGVPQVKVLDFGIARLYSLTGTGNTITQTLGQVVGTPQYMSPEQCQGKDVDGRSDLYSLGVMLYQMLSGDLPFKADNPGAYLIAHVTETPVPLSALNLPTTIPPDLDRLVMRLLAKDRAKRPASAAEVLEALGAVLENRPIVRERPQALRRRYLVALIAAMGVAMVGIAAWLALRPGPEAPPAPSTPVAPAPPPEVAPKAPPQEEPARTEATAVPLPVQKAQERPSAAPPRAARSKGSRPATGPVPASAPASPAPVSSPAAAPPGPTVPTKAAAATPTLPEAPGPATTPPGAQPPPVKRPASSGQWDDEFDELDAFTRKKTR